MRATPVLVVVAIAVLALPSVWAQAPIDRYELADYRLTADVFERFVKATTRIAEITTSDDSFTDAPLFTKDVALSGDAVVEVEGLAARLERHSGLAAALDAATITPREYAKFAISLVGAHLAYNFVKAGVLKRVPSGAPTTNVEFVKAHDADVTAALESLGIRD